MSKEKATKYVRLYPSLCKRIRIKAAKAGKSMACIIEEQDRFFSNYGRYTVKAEDPFVKLMEKAVNPEAKSDLQ